MMNVRLKWKSAARTALLGFILSMPLEASLSKVIQYDGHAEAYFYSPHNEFDPNPGLPFCDRTVSRYGLELEVEHLRLRRYPAVFLFGTTRTYFGDSRPQIDYNYDGQAIVSDIVYGAGLSFLKDFFELRVTHGQWVSHGHRYQGEKLMWTALSLRANFSN